MKNVPITLIALILSGCANRPVVSGPQPKYVEHAIKMAFCEMAIMERSTLDSAQQPFNGVLDEKANAESLLPILHAEWNQRIEKIRNGTFAGTEAWSAEKREEVIAYANHQREFLGLKLENEK